MADDKKPAAAPVEHDAFVEITWLLLSLFVVLYIISSLFSFFNSSGLSSLWNGYSLNPKTIAMSKVPSLLGDKVSTSKSTPVYREPGLNQFATEPAGAKGTLIEGPLVKDGVKYWHVRFDDGTDGWVPEDALSYLQISKIPLSSAKDPKNGDGVSVSVPYAQVFSEPGLNQIAREKKNSSGKIVGGPALKDNVKYWQVQFDDGTTGWVKESDLDYLQSKPVPLSSMPSIIGDSVVASKDGTPVYDTPGGKKIGTQKKGAHGTVIEGPLVKDGVKYWHVRFDDGTDGWVSEDDLEYVQSGGYLGLIGKFFHNLVTFWKYFAVLISLGLGYWVYVLFGRVKKLRQDEADLLYPEKVEIKSPTNTQWDKIVRHVESLHENDWKLAIIDADILLAELLEKLSLPGETIGEKLKSVDKSNFKTIDNAWEAHKIRNQIAHEGIVFLINQQEAKRVISLYQSVFEEFKVI